MTAEERAEILASVAETSRASLAEAIARHGVDDGDPGTLRGRALSRTMARRLLALAFVFPEPVPTNLTTDDALWRRGLVEYPTGYGSVVLTPDGLAALADARALLAVPHQRR